MFELSKGGMPFFIARSIVDIETFDISAIFCLVSKEFIRNPPCTVAKKEDGFIT
jgi:hypothetical protein